MRKRHVRSQPLILIAGGRFPQMLDLLRGLKIGVPSGCLGERSIFEIIMLSDRSDHPLPLTTRNDLLVLTTEASTTLSTVVVCVRQMAALSLLNDNEHGHSMTYHWETWQNNESRRIDILNLPNRTFTKMFTLSGQKIFLIRSKNPHN